VKRGLLSFQILSCFKFFHELNNGNVVFIIKKSERVWTGGFSEAIRALLLLGRFVSEKLLDTYRRLQRC